MTSPLEWLFWLSFATVLYTYFLYPLLIAALNRLRPARSATSTATAPRMVSIIIPVHNEEAHLPRRLDELTRMMQASGIRGEIIVVSDASTDRSVEIARSFADRGVRVLEMPTKQGKAAALTAGASAAQHELLVFADARQRWADDALSQLVSNFADPAIGAVSGDLVLESAPGVLAGVGLYWRFEKWLRKQESRWGAQVGVTGAICAVRKSLFRAIPPGTLLDDVYWPMLVALEGSRVIHDERAVAFDRLPENPRDEFRRKVRTLAGNFQLLTLLPGAALLPWRNRVWWQWVSRKLMRLVVPWALIAMLVASFFLADDLYEMSFYGALFRLQVIGYTIGLLGVLPGLSRIRLFGVGASFLTLNAAAWLAFWVWITGRAGTSWHKVQYQPAAEET